MNNSELPVAEIIFFNFMIGTVLESRLINGKAFKEGEKFVAIMTHSGSRGIGHKSAKHYHNLAVDFIKSKSQNDSFYQGIPKGYEFLPLETEQGEEYWKVMQLMGEYAGANHNLIHDHFMKELGCRAIARLENHHNFAWEKDGIYIHRKGATPAGHGEIGIIPGSMGTKSYIVEGRGNPDSIGSSSHGAGRLSSRTQAKKNIDRDAFHKLITEKDIVTVGIAADETNQAYKDIERVISLQVKDKVILPIAHLEPKIVMMGRCNKPGNDLDRITE